MHLRRHELIVAVCKLRPVVRRFRRRRLLSLSPEILMAYSLHREKAYPQELRQARQRAGRSLPAGHSKGSLHSDFLQAEVRPPRNGPTRACRRPSIPIFPIVSHTGNARVGVRRLYAWPSRPSTCSECQQRGLTFAVAVACQGASGHLSTVKPPDTRQGGQGAGSLHGRDSAR